MNDNRNLKIYKQNNKFFYEKNKQQVLNSNHLEKIKKIIIPPAYKNVKIDLSPKAKIIATGYDDAGRKQYIYSQNHIVQRKFKKYCSLIDFSKGYEKLDAKINALLRTNKLDKEVCIALILKIIQNCYFRIGNQKCLEKYNSFGISTLNPSQAYINNKKIKFEFVGKKGVLNLCQIENSEDYELISTKLRQLNELNKNKQYLFIPKNETISITSLDVNSWLKNFYKKIKLDPKNISSKTFRTFYANMLFIETFLKKYGKLNKQNRNTQDQQITKRKRFINEIKKEIAEKLHHTPAVYSKEYLLKEIPELYINDPQKFKKEISSNTNNSKKKYQFILQNFLQSYCKDDKTQNTKN